MSGTDPPMLLFLGMARALCEVALLFLLGQGALALLAGARRHSNPVYRLFVILTRPVLRLARALLPAAILDRHLPFVAFSILLWAWLGLAWLKKSYCDAHLLRCF